MAVPKERRHLFGRTDRIAIAGATYRPFEKANGMHVLQLVVDNVLEEHFVTKSDADINDLMHRKA